MFDNILLPIDLNHPESWEKALPMALRLCAGSDKGCSLHIMGIVHDLGSALVASYLPADFEKKALQHMKADLDTFQAEHVPPGINTQVHVGHGHVPETLLKMADQVGADVIVMASHPPDDLRHLLVGSYAEKVVRHATIPVLTVR